MEQPIIHRLVVTAPVRRLKYFAL